MPNRKYVSEFALNMIGTHRSLLQQKDLQWFIDSGIEEEYPSHIYMITRHPRICIDDKSVKVSKDIIEMCFKIQRQDTFEFQKYKFHNEFGTDEIEFQCPYPHSEFIFYTKQHEKIFYGKSALLWAFIKNDFKLEVLYIGQSYGKQGERTAPNRLLCHSTLQSIYADSICSHPDKEIWIILWHFEPLTICSFDGRHKVYEATFEQDKEHMYTVLNKLITEQQMINFTEAALIKYFKPFYNDKFKYNFPNQAHKTYAECYDIDLNAVIVELQTDEVFCKLWSEGVESN